MASKKNRIKRQGGPLLTPELINEIEDLIKQGYSNQDVCDVLSFSQASFYNWVNIGEEQKEGNFTKSEDLIYLEFVEAIKKARAEHKQNLLSKIQRHGNKQWQALAWVLERKYKDEFGKVDTVKIDTTKNKAVDKTLELLKERELEDEFDSNE